MVYIEDPLGYDFDMDDALMAVRWLPHGQGFSDEELKEYIIERLADFEEALEETDRHADYTRWGCRKICIVCVSYSGFICPNCGLFIDSIRTLIGCRYVTIGIDLKRAYEYKYSESHFLFFPKI